MREVSDEEFRRVWEQMEWIAHSLMRRMRIPVYDEDALQQARIALFKALRFYDPSRGSKLSSFYYRCLRGALAEYCYWRRFGAQYPRNGRRWRKKPELPEFVSLYDKYELPGGDEVEWLDTVKDPTDHYEELVNREHRRWLVDRILSTLREEDRMIIRLYYGLDGEGMSLQEIGDRLGITREAVRQRLHRILRTLRNQMGSKWDPKKERWSLHVR